MTAAPQQRTVQYGTLYPYVSLKFRYNRYHEQKTLAFGLLPCAIALLKKTRQIYDLDSVDVSPPPLPLPPSQNYDRAGFRVPEHFLSFQKFRDFSWEEGWKRSNIFARSCCKISVCLCC